LQQGWPDRNHKPASLQDEALWIMALKVCPGFALLSHACRMIWHMSLINRTCFPSAIRGAAIHRIRSRRNPYAARAMIVRTLSARRADQAEAPRRLSPDVLPGSWIPFRFSTNEIRH